MKSELTGKQVLFLFPHQTIPEMQRVMRGESPTELLYGFKELQENGWDVRLSDTRFSGPWASSVRFLGRLGINAIDPHTIAEIRAADVVVVKDKFSLMVTLACKLFGTRLIYLDSMFSLPARWWKRWATKVSIRLADRVIGYSQAQVSRWVNELKVPSTNFTVLPYTLDMSFYAPQAGHPDAGEGVFLLAIGRDMGRDFATLIEAARGADVGLKLVTLPYLLKDIDLDGSAVDVLQRLSYADLFALYRRAAAVVIPLHPGIDYPSGIRAMLEALVLGKKVIVTRTPVLQEYIDDNEVTFVNPRDVENLTQAILESVKVHRDDHHRREQTRQKLISKYDMSSFVDGFEATIRSTIGKRE